ncbi:RNA ligase family protein [Mycolicibacterium fortuitum]|uniref:RNA ligase family protein n=1 Tax=Mycolicibacterium fortuitum TaxID=1766 RepID=UPI00260275A5|nr:RNA ligase family protein [Mycolicibacterium fortuitum]
MKINPPANPNYAATIVKVPPTIKLDGLDNLVGVPLFGYQALTQNTTQAGDLRVLFTAETELDFEYARENDLHRDESLNVTDGATGYLEKHRRIKAVKLRGHRSNALLMPLESLLYTGFNIDTLQPGDTFDELNGHTICRKYVAPVKEGTPRRVGPKIKQRIDQKHFPMHVDTEHLFRNLDRFRQPTRVVVTQKLHGTSWRGGRVPVAREKGRVERFLNRWFPTKDHEHEVVFGSRRVIKGHDGNNHFYDTDVWTEFGKTIADRIPEGFLVYGELIGWTLDGDGNASPIQKGYTYNVTTGQGAELYVYRVATINTAGIIADLSWEGVKEFCASAGLSHAPELATDVIWAARDDDATIAYYTEQYLDLRLTDRYDNALPLSDRKTVDEGVCVRVEGVVPRIFKARSPKFLEWETKALDRGDADLEATA